MGHYDLRLVDEVGLVGILYPYSDEIDVSQDMNTPLPIIGSRFSDPPHQYLTWSSLGAIFEKTPVFTRR
jgi:hypothetical protein